LTLRLKQDQDCRREWQDEDEDNKVPFSLLDSTCVRLSMSNSMSEFTGPGMQGGFRLA